MVSPTRMEWDCASNCLNPKTFERHSRDDWKTHKWISPNDGYKPSLTLTMHVRCRRCEECLKARSRLWRARAMAEYERSSRVWFSTLTLNAEWRAKIRYEAELIARKASVPELTNEPKNVRFRYECRVLWDHVTRYIKRVRHHIDAPMRYILVAEMHKDGTPHLHMLVFEQQMGTIRKHHLKDQWFYGFTKIKLADDARAVWYVTKYLTKSADMRVRASLYFGK